MSSSNNGNGKIIPMPFQKETVENTEQKFNGRALIADEMGLGKTNSSLWFVKRKRLGETLPLLIICTVSVRHQWVQSVEEILNIHPALLKSRKPSKSPSQEKVAIITYDIVAWWRDWLHNQNYHTLILDECQFCKNPKSKRTKAALALAKQIRFFLPLSGTPLLNRPIELFPTINAVNPREWPRINDFGHKYCGPKFGRWGWEFKGASNIDELHARLKQTCMIRHLQKDVLKQLPPMTRTIVPVELRNAQEYLKAKNDFIGWLKDRYPDRLTKAMKAATLVRSGHLLRLAAKLKLRSVVDWINQRLNQSDEKIIVFAVHKKCIRALKRRIHQKSVIVDGSVTGNNRTAAIAQFQNDKRTRVFIGNIAAAGIGLNLVQANTLCAAELSYTPGSLLQMEKRIHRIGQEKPCWIYYFIGIDTIEESVSRLVQRKQKVITGTLDGSYAEDDFDLYDQLIEELEKGNM